MNVEAPTLFPPSSLKGLPEFSSLLITGPYHPSAPIYLALSLSNIHQHRSAVFHPSRTEFVANLKHFNDAWLLSRSGHGSMTEITSNIDIFYPPSPAHLCLLLSVFCAERPKIPAGITFSSTSRQRAWDVIMLLEPSKYFFASDGRPQSNLSLSSYLTLIQRSLACISKLASYTRPLKFVLFDSRLHDLKLPMTREPLKFPEAGDGDRSHQVHALPLVETYFQMAGIFEDDHSLVPSSQGDETNQDAGIPKQLRLHYVDRPSSDFILFQWRETQISMPDSDEGTWFNF